MAWQSAVNSELNLYKDDRDQGERRGEGLRGKRPPNSQVNQMDKDRLAMVWVGMRRRRKRESSGPAVSKEGLAGQEKNF